MPIIQKYVPSQTEPLENTSPTIGRRGRGRPKGSKNKNGSQIRKTKQPITSGYQTPTNNGTTIVVQSTSTRGVLIKHLPIRHQTGLSSCIGACKEGCLICNLLPMKRDEKGWPILVTRKGKINSSVTTAEPQSTLPKKEKSVTTGDTPKDIITTMTTVLREDETLDLSQLFGGNS